MDTVLIIIFFIALFMVWFGCLVCFAGDKYDKKVLTKISYVIFIIGLVLYIIFFALNIVNLINVIKRQ